MLDLESLRLFSEVARKFDNGFRRLPAFQNQSPGMARLAEVLNATAEDPEGKTLKFKQRHHSESRLFLEKKKNRNIKHANIMIETFNEDDIMSWCSANITSL